MTTWFAGLHHASDAGKVGAGFISVHELRRRKAPLRCPGDWPWIMDSGAFTTIAAHGGYPEPVEEYAAQVRRFAGDGQLLAAVSQDYMCEPVMLARTGLTVADHQLLTIERYDALRGCDTAGIPIMPVLQGYAPAEYVRHLTQYGDRLKPGMRVGVGSICKRNASPAAVEDVLLAVKRERFDLRLHGFGIKITALGSQLVRDLLYSADSMAWSLAARWEGRDRNDVAEAVRYAARVARMPTQRSFLGWMRT